MKKLLSIILALATPFTCFNMPTNAASKKQQSTIIQPLHSGCSIEVQMPSFKAPIRSNSAMTCFYSSSGKIILKNPERLPDGCQVVVRIKQPKLCRKARRLFLKGLDNPGENRFSMKVTDVKYSWFDIFGKLLSLFMDHGIYVDYGIVPLSMPDDKKLDVPLAKEGDKKKSVVDEEKFKKLVEEINGKAEAQQVAEEYRAKLHNIISKKNNKEDIIELAKAHGLDILVPDDGYNPGHYYSFPEAQTENKKRAEAREKIEAKLAESEVKNSVDDIICVLSKENPIQAFRLVVNNNTGEGGQADLLAALLANQAKIGQSLIDDSIVSFDYTIESKLPNRLENPLTEEDKAAAKRVQELLEKAKAKPSLFKVIEQLMPDIIKDTLHSVLNIATFGKVNDNEIKQRVREVKETKNKDEKPKDTKENTATQSLVNKISRKLGVESSTLITALILAPLMYFGISKAFSAINSMNRSQIVKWCFAALPISLVLSIAKFLWSVGSDGAGVVKAMVGKK